MTGQNVCKSTKAGNRAHLDSGRKIIVVTIEKKKKKERKKRKEKLHPDARPNPYF